MEFFSWMVDPLQIIDFFSFSKNSTFDAAMSHVIEVVTIEFWIAVGLYLLGHIFGGFGLYKLAKRAGDKFAWMAFVPILNTYLSGRLAGETKVFGAKCKRLGLYVSLIEILYIAISAFMLVLSFCMLRGAFIDISDRQLSDGTIVRILTFKSVETVPVNIRWIMKAYDIIYFIKLFWYFVTLFMFIMLYSAFFRKYYARSPFTMAFLCSFFPVRGYVLFAVRNNAAIDYDQWMQANIRRMQQQQAQQYGGPQPPYGGSYGGNSYGGPQGGEPFSDVSGTNDSTNGGTPPDSNEPFSDL